MRFCALPLLDCSALSRGHALIFLRVATQYHRDSRPRHARALPRIATLCYALPPPGFAMHFPGRASPCESMPQHCRATPCETMPKLCFADPAPCTSELYCALAPQRSAILCHCLALPSFAVAEHISAVPCPLNAKPSRSKSSLCLSLQCRCGSAHRNPACP